MGLKGAKKLAVLVLARLPLLLIPLISTLPAACARREPREIRISAKIRKPVKLTIMGLQAHWTTGLVTSMAPLFVEHAKTKHGYEAKIQVDCSSFASYFAEVSRIMNADPEKLNLLIIDSQILGALAEGGWILRIDELVKRFPELSPEWYDPMVKKYYQEYPDGSGRLWGLPCAGDAIALFVRKDLFEAPEERSAFRKKHGFPLPRSFEDWEKLDMADFEKIAGFFTRPERGMWGTSMQYNEEHDFISMSLYPFMFSMGGKIWEPSERRVSGVLDSEVNAEAMARHRRMLACQPPMSVNFTTQQTIFYFYNMMSVATAFQWVEHGVYMVGRELEGKVDVVPPPSFRRRDGARRRVYPCGGQPWVINSRNDPDHMRVAVDYLRWWYLPETQAEYAKRGGIPVDRTTLSNPGFDGMHPWHRAYKYMHTGERTDDFWHDPCYVDLLAAQQAGFHSYASGEENDAGRVLERIACMQQKILFDAGRSTVSPPPECGVGESGR